MSGKFLGSGVDLETAYVDNYAMIDQHAKTGTLWLMGDNTYGQLGDNTIANKSSPVQTIAAGTNWKQVTNGTSHTAAIKTDGTLWLWGRGAQGRLGTNTTTNRSSPVQTIAGGTNWKQVATWSSHTAAIKTDGTLWLWGYNANGELGNNAITNLSSPVQTVAGGTNWKLVACGFSGTAAIKTDGTLWLWGANSAGQLGDNTVVKKSSPIQTIAGGTNWKQVAVGSSTTAAIKTDGTLWLWGTNNSGSLGNNDATTNKSSPIQTIAGGTNWKAVSSSDIGIVGAIKTDGTLWTWGYNFYGQLGDNTRTSKSSPVQTIAGGTNWKQIEFGSQTMVAVKTDGTRWAWGDNLYGQLGTNNTTSRSSPVQTIAGGTNWKQTSSSGYTTTAIYFYDAGNLYAP